MESGDMPGPNRSWLLTPEEREANRKARRARTADWLWNNPKYLARRVYVPSTRHSARVMLVLVALVVVVAMILFITA